MRNTPGDTIAAISTPLGMGGIGVVRISGPKALAVAERLFRRRTGTGPLQSHRFYLGEIIRPEDQTVLDEVMLVFMREPKTYTREDVVEIQCHSGALVLREILQTVINGGCRIAEPGEFTKRAFLNGRIDLTQAEAVMDLISSRTERSLDLANRLRAGRLSEKVKEIRELLLDLLAGVEAVIDFPEEEIPEPRETGARLKSVRTCLDSLLETYREGRVYREGVAAVIVGRPNVGKSSLLNALLREERAIVTEVPGTTRDIIEEGINIKGVPLRIVDTAGLRSARDRVEAEGVRRSWESLDRADLALWVMDRSAPLSAEDMEILPRLRNKKTLLVLNKSDLPPVFSPGDLKELFPEAPSIVVSALAGSGIEDLKGAIHDLVLNGTVESSAEVILTNLRHKQALEAAREAVVSALESDPARLFPECLALDLQRALESLGEIVGETTPEEVLNRIFSQFCIGK